MSGGKGGGTLPGDQARALFPLLAPPRVGQPFLAESEPLTKGRVQDLLGLVQDDGEGLARRPFSQPPGGAQILVAQGALQRAEKAQSSVAAQVERLMASLQPGQKACS